MIEIFTKLKGYSTYVFEQGSLGFSLPEIFIFIILFLFAIIIRGFFAKIIISRIKKVVQKTGNRIDDNIFDVLASPLKTLPLIIVFILIGLFANNESQFYLIIEKINQTLVTIFIFWSLHQSLVPLSQAFQKLEELLSKALVSWLTKSLKYLIIFLGTVAVLEVWGIKIGPVIAGLGLFGVAIALGAQDLFKNLISGIMIILEKRFELNDVIELPSHATGTVEHIGFRSTVIRQFDSTPISIPNYVFSDTAVINFSQRNYRRINWVIGLTYETSVKQLKDICSNIDSTIRSKNEFIVNETYKLFVNVNKFNNSSIDVLVQAFTNTNDWEQYIKIKENLAFDIKNIVESNGSSFAFPSQSIYMEKK